MYVSFDYITVASWDFKKAVYGILKAMEEKKLVTRYRYVYE